MANNAFDRLNFGTRERPISADYNRQASQADRSLRDLVQSLVSARTLSSSTGAPYSGFFGDGFRCVPTSPVALSVQLIPGIGFFYDPVNLPVDIGATDLAGVDDRSSYKPMVISTPQIFAVPTAPGAGQSRIDIIEARYDLRLEDAQTRRQLDVASKSFQDKVFLKTLALNLDGRTGFVSSPALSTAALSYKTGAAAATGSEVEPSVTTGYVKVARINVGPAVTTIDNNVLVDRRPIVHPGGMVPFYAAWRVQWNAGTPIHTTLAMSAPAGTRLCLAPLALRGSGSFFAVGGEILHATCTITAGPSAGNVNTNALSIGLQEPQGSGVQVATVDSTIQTLLAAGTPAINVGIGAKVHRGRIISRFITNTGASNNTDTSLEDVVIQVSGTLAYV